MAIRVTWGPQLGWCCFEKKKHFLTSVDSPSVWVCLLCSFQPQFIQPFVARRLQQDFFQGSAMLQTCWLVQSPFWSEKLPCQMLVANPIKLSQSHQLSRCVRPTSSRCMMRCLASTKVTMPSRCLRWEKLRFQRMLLKPPAIQLWGSKYLSLNVDSFLWFLCKFCNDQNGIYRPLGAFSTRPICEKRTSSGVWQAGYTQHKWTWAFYLAGRANIITNSGGVSCIR